MFKSAIAAVAFTLIGSAALADPPVDNSRFQEIAKKTLAQNGIQSKDIDRIAIEPLLGSRDSVLEGVLATVYLDQCADGYVVVRMTSTGVVKTAFGRSGCAIGSLTVN